MNREGVQSLCSNMPEVEHGGHWPEAPRSFLRL